MFLTSILTSNDSFLVTLLVVFAYFSALILAMSVHEFGHAHAALKQGDMTAKTLGRYTLAPFAHVDITGIIFLIIFGFGWAKPVPIDARNFKNGKKSELLVYSSGILTNLIVGIVFALIYCAINVLIPSMYVTLGAYGVALEYFLQYMVLLNFIFAFFNLLPFAGFDGYNIISTFTRPDNAFLSFMRRYGYFVLILCVFTGAISFYIDLVALNLVDLIINGFTKLFMLFI